MNRPTLRHTGFSLPQLRDPLRTPNRRSARRGSTYIAVIGVAVIVSIIGFAGIHIARVQMRSVEADNDTRRAKLLARAAVEQAIANMNQSSSWRTSYTNNVETAPINFGGGTISFKLVDPDGDLADDATDSVWIYGYGRVGDAVWVEKAYARIDGGKPLEFLRTALHAGSINLSSGADLTVVGAPASADGNIDLNGGGTSIVGDAEAASQTGGGTITGTTTVPATAKGMPASSVYTSYVNRATALTYSGNLQNVVLAPTINQYDGSGTNPDGVYYINTGGANLTINRLRLVGTLIIDVGAGTLTIQEITASPYRSDFPVLIVKGNVTLSQWSTTVLETLALKSLNPAGAPYNGSEDNDLLDTYPNRVDGLVHIIGNLTTWDNAGTWKGVMLVTGSADISVSGTITHDPSLMDNPPLGYTEDPASTKMIISSRSWTRTTAP